MKIQTPSRGYWRSLVSIRIWAVLAAGLPVLVSAQEVDDLVGVEDIYELSPFEVDGSGNQGYLAASTLAGSRLNTQLKDVASAISVVTPEFLDDTGVTNVAELLVYTTSTEAAGLQGNYFGSSSGDSGYVNALLAEPHKSTRVRGLDAADLTRDFFLTDVPMDSYNIDGVDIQRGPNSVLFGLGSPAGIINYKLKNASLYSDIYKAKIRFGSYNLLRSEFDINKVLIENKLAVRFSGMNQERDFEQKFKYEKSQRGFASMRWTPKLADKVYTQITVNYERGDIDANRPRVLPPEDLLSTWFNNWNQATGPNLDGPGNREYYGDYIYDHYTQGGPAGKWWDELSLVFADPGSTATGGNGAPDAMRQRGGNPWAGWYSPNNPTGGVWGLHELAQKEYFANSPELLAIANQFESATGRTFAGFGGYGTTLIMDPSIFDYRKETLEGPNSYQHNDFDVFNLSLVQTYLDDKLGLELVYDSQDYTSGYENLIGGESRISVDVNEYLRDGTPNPNLGRPFTVDQTDGNITDRERESFRATVYYKLDFNEILKRSWLSQALGSHTFTGIYSSQKASAFSRNYFLWGMDDRYSDSNDNLAAIHYLNTDVGSNLFGASSVSGIGVHGLQTVQAPPSEISAMVQGFDGLPDWSVIQVGTTTNIDDLYKDNAWANKDTTKTKSFIWQSRFLNDNVIGLFGYRKDDYTKLDKPRVPVNVDSVGLPYDSSWTYDGVTPVHAEGITRTWGLMVHSPEFINRRLPLGTTISVGYNQSENFRPSEVGVDYYGNQLPAPSGTTKDYTLLVSTFDGRLNLRATWYKTEQQNATFRGTGPGGGVKWRLARTMNGMMTETWNDGLITGDQNDSSTWVGRQNTTPEWLVNKWMFGDNYDQATANEALPNGWTVDSHPELLEQPLRIRRSASVVTGPEVINTVTGTAYSEPPISPEEATYRKAWFAARSDAEWYRPIGKEIFDGLEFRKVDSGQWGFWDGNVPANLKNTTDLISKGVEFEITVNPTNNWRIMVNISKQEAMYTNIMPSSGKIFEDLHDLIHDGYVSGTINGDYWERDGFADIDHWGANNGQALDDLVTDEERNYLIGKAAEGRPVNDLRKWRWNLISSYDFSDESLFRGFGVGGSVRWQDCNAIGYYPEYNEVADIWVSDLNRPYYGDSETNYDFWASYKRTIFKGKVDWKLQLNIRNLFASEDLIPVSANPDGTIAQARIPAATTYWLTNSFSF